MGKIISLSLVFKDNLICSHSHSWVGDRWRNEIVFCGEKRIYRLDVWKGTVQMEEGNSVRTIKQDSTSIYTYENQIFLDMVKGGDWGKNPSDYDDGLLTLQLTLACNRAIDSGNERL